MDFSNKQILFFDGFCNLCTGSVQFIIKRDKKNKLQFASLQSEAGQQMLQKFGLPTQELNSLIFVDDNIIYQKSTGALRIAKYLSGAWPLAYGLTIIPAFIRNAVYNWVAKNRYKWFGKKNECWLPTPELNKKFIS
jgi:predicted DCC family thiol-disulfide oxidoreductase YuxK